MTKAIRGRRRNGRGDGDGNSGSSSSIRGNNVQSIDRKLGYYKHSYDDDYVYNAQTGSHTNYTQLVQNYETTAKSYASNATIIARGYYDAANSGDWDNVIVPLLVVTVVLAFCLGCCMGRCCCNNDKGDDADDGDDENLLSASRSGRRRSSRQKILKTRSGTPRRRYNLEESFTETDNESYYSRYGYDETDDDDDDYYSDGTGYNHPGSPSSLSDYKSAQRESAARRKTLAATKRAAIAMKAKATAEAALAKATAKSDITTKEEETKNSNADWPNTSKQAEVETSVSAQVKKFDESSASSTTTSEKKETRKWGKLVSKKKSDPLLEARSRSHNFVGYYAT